MTTQKKINRHILWLIKHKDIIKINRIETDLNMPQGTLKKFVDGKRGLDDQWNKCLIDYIAALRV